MRFPGTNMPVFDALVGAGFAIAAVFFDLVLVPVPLYLTEGCEPNSCVNIAPRIHLVPLIAGVLAASVSSYIRMRRITRTSIVLGLAMGTVAVLFAGLLDAATLPFTDPYFTTFYKVWALAVVFTIMSAAVAAATWWSRTATHPFTVTAIVGLGLVVAAVIVSTLGRQAPVAVAATAGVATGLIAGRFGRRPRAPRPAHLVAVLVVIAFVSRAVFGLQTLAATGPGMAFAVASDDGDSYFTLASRLAGDTTALGETLSGIAFPPGYTVFIAAVLAASDGSLAAVIVVQALLAAVAAYCVYLLGRRMFGVAAGLLACALFSLDQNLIQNASTLTAEALLIPVVLGALAAVSSYIRTRTFGYLVLGAALVGCAFVVRNVVAMPLLIAVIVTLAVSERARPMLVVRNVGLILVVTMLWSLPIAVATAQKDGTPRFTTQLAGLAWTFDGGKGYTIPNRVLVARGIDPFADPLGSLGRALADPGLIASFYAEAAPQRFATLMFFANRGYSDPLILVNEAYFPNAFGETVRLVRIGLLLVGVWIVIRSRAWRTAPEIPTIALYALLYISVFVFVFPPYHAFRYRIPVEPVRFMFEAGGVLALWAAFRLVSTRGSTVSRA